MATNQFTLRVPKDLERRLSRCRASIRVAIRERLREIARTVATRGGADEAPAATQGPPLRFYVLEGYRVSYEVNTATRSVVLLDLHAEPA